jgi:hypothetical protein
VTPRHYGGMTSDGVGTALTVVATLAALVGLADSILGGSADLTVIFVIVLAACLAQLRIRPLRRPVRLRADLMRWLTERAQLAGEPVEQVADRAVAAYRSGLGEHDSAHG